MKKFFIGLLTVLMVSIGLIGVILLFTLSPKWYSVLLFFIGWILIFVPATFWWADYFNNLFHMDKVNIKIPEGYIAEQTTEGDITTVEFKKKTNDP